MPLVSPGVQVTVTDESFFSSAGPGTVPLIFIASKQDKLTSDGSSTALGTTAANADSLYLISSQRELLQTFGDPDFNEIGGLAQNGSPLNEYGLLAAYSYLGLANRAYVIRADIDLNELEGTSIAPTSAAADNAYWNNTGNLTPGLFRWTASDTWAAVVTTTFIGDENGDEAALITTGLGNSEPSSGYVDGDIIVNLDNVGNVQYLHRDGGDWYKAGTSAGRGFRDFQWAPHTFVPSVNQSDDSTPLVAGDLWLKTTTPNSGLDLDVSFYDSSLGQFVSLGDITISDTHTAYYALAGGGVTHTNPAAGTVVGFVDSIDSYAGTFNTTAPTPQTTSEADVVLEIHNGATTVAFTGASPVAGTITDDTTTVFTLNGTVTTTFGTAVTAGMTGIDEVVVALNLDPALAAHNVIASKSATDQVILTSSDGSDIIITSASTSVIGELFIVNGTTSNFESFATSALASSYEADATAPAGAVTDGTYWYDPSFIVDILENDGAGVWDDFAGTISVQSDEPTSPISGDLWVETDQASYPVIYRYTTEWVLVDNTDQTTPLGIVFGDARPAPVTAGSGTGINNGGGDLDLDADRPDPLLYPGGTLLFNTRYSGRNVKVWTENATFSDDAGLVPVDRWVTSSGNNPDGSLVSGSDAQQAVVANAIGAVMTANQQVRDDTIFYNLIAAPGYVELMDEMLALNLDRKEQAFVIGDVPFHLADDTTSLQEWSANSNSAAGNGNDGLVSASSNLGVYYPSALTTNTDGTDVVVPSSHMTLRVLAYNDQVAYPWYAPAGFTRGTVSNASAVGYLDSSDSFVVSSLNQGQRDVLQLNNVNPIASIPNRGLVVYGQKTRQGTSSALDRVNVARLINHVRYQSDLLAQPFLFEPNDSVTRGAVKEAFDAFLSEIVTLRGITDFLVVVDESNNTPERIDRSELWIDIAIQPTKSVEFIYIPIRLQNSGDDLNL